MVLAEAQRTRRKEGRRTARKKERLSSPIFTHQNKVLAQISVERQSANLRFNKSVSQPLEKEEQTATGHHERCNLMQHFAQCHLQRSATFSTELASDQIPRSLTICGFLRDRDTKKCLRVQHSAPGPAPSD